MENPLNVWLISTGKMVTDSKIQEVTHFMFDGGKLDISIDYETFQMMYCKFFHHKNCIVERKTPYFKFFIDFDFLSEDVVSIDEYVNTIQTTLVNLYKINDLKCIITGADKFKKVFKGDKLYLKQGYHLHWPDIIVNKETAKCIRNNLIVNLTNVYGKNEKHYESWDKIIDKCVYEKNGLRLVGSDKCTISDGIKVYENRIYVLKEVYTGIVKNETLREIYETNLLDLIKDTSIRSKEEKETTVYNLRGYTEEEESVKPSGNLINMERKSIEYKSIEKFFKLHAIGYRVEDIRTISKVKDKQMFLISSKSKFCQNKQDFHSNNHVYFKLTPSGLCQKCLSESSGVHGPCRDYQSSFVSITPALESSLNWKKPKTKDKDKNIKTPDNFSISGLLEKMENNFTCKDAFRGPGPIRKK